MYFESNLVPEPKQNRTNEIQLIQFEGGSLDSESARVVQNMMCSMHGFDWNQMTRRGVNSIGVPKCCQGCEYYTGKRWSGCNPLYDRLYSDASSEFPIIDSSDIYDQEVIDKESGNNAVSIVWLRGQDGVYVLKKPRPRLVDDEHGNEILMPNHMMRVKLLNEFRIGRYLNRLMPEYFPDIPFLFSDSNGNPVGLVQDYCEGKDLRELSIFFKDPRDIVKGSEFIQTVSSICTRLSRINPRYLLDSDAISPNNVIWNHRRRSLHFVDVEYIEAKMNLDVRRRQIASAMATSLRYYSIPDFSDNDISKIPFLSDELM